MRFKYHEEGSHDFHSVSSFNLGVSLTPIFTAVAQIRIKIEFTEFCWTMLPSH